MACSKKRKTGLAFANPVVVRVKEPEEFCFFARQLG